MDKKNCKIFPGSKSRGILVVIILIIIVTATLVARKSVSNNTKISEQPSIIGNESASTETQAGSQEKQKAAIQKAGEKQASKRTEKQLPRLVDLGAGKCIPCKMMAPILEELSKEYAGRLRVEVIDVWENPSAGDQYKIRVIPTQIFFDPSGKELFRHEGFIGKEDILSQWKELGFSLEKER